MRLQKPLEIVLSFTTLSYIQQRIFNVLLWFAFNESRYSPFYNNHLIKVSLLKKIIHQNINTTNDFYLRNAINNMADSVYCFNIFNIDSSLPNTINKSLLSFIKVENSIVRYSFDSTFETYFKEDNKNIVLLLSDIVSLGSKYSLRLYDIALASMKYDIKSFPFDVFKKMMGVDTGYDNVSEFKKRVLSISKNEICKYTDIFIGYYINTKQNTIFLYPNNKNEIKNTIKHINTIFVDTNLFYKNKLYVYKNTYLDNSTYMFCLAIVSVVDNKELILSKNSIQEITFFIKKNIIITL